MVDLNLKTKSELQQMLQNCARRPDDAQAQYLAEEIKNVMSRRGLLNSSDWKGKWNSAEVAEALKPFAEVAKSVKGNQRTSYTTAGGLHVGRNKMNPEWKFVDSYSAIKTKNLNAVMICQVDRPGDDAIFVLQVSTGNKEKAVVVQGDRTILPAALEKWKELARSAVI